LEAFTSYLVSEATVVSRKVSAAWTGAPPNLGVLIHKLLDFECHVLNVEVIIFFEASPIKNFFDIIVIIILVTLMIAAFHSQNFGGHNKIFEVFTDAAPAKLVIAGLKLEEFTLRLALVTDLACFIISTWCPLGLCRWFLSDKSFLFIIR
jgi:hypothetical protein